MSSTPFNIYGPTKGMEESRERHDGGAAQTELCRHGEHLSCCGCDCTCHPRMARDRARRDG